MYSSYSVNHHFRMDEQEEQRRVYFFLDYAHVRLAAYQEEASEEDGNGRYGEEYSTLFEMLKCATMKVIQTSGAGNVVEEGSVW